ncbi:MAG: hypothetical protein K1X42_17660 [Opitutaceae bacterium]|nr:hypothetical protein [Opitutaceae bacterium]
MDEKLQMTIKPIDDRKPRLLDVDGPIRDLLLDIQYRHAVLPTPVFAALRSGTWEKLSLTNYKGALSIDGSTLNLLLENTEHFGLLLEMMRVRNMPAELQLADGSIVCAEFAHMKRLNKDAYIDLYNWTWSTRATPWIWVGRLCGKVPRTGNLSLVERGDGWSRAIGTAYCMSGSYKWYIVPESESAQANQSSTLLVDPAGKSVTRATLRSDLLALEFAFGGSLSLDYLVGLDHGRVVAGALSLGSIGRGATNYRPPVPHEYSDFPLWGPEFFRLLAAKLRQDGLEPLIIPITAYLDSERDHLDGAYMKAQVGLEAFAKRVTRHGSPALVVKDAKAWKQWASSLSTTIRAHLVDEKHLDAVLGKFIAAMHAPSGDLVRQALATHGITIPKHVADEIRKRNYPAHGFLMNPTLAYDFDGDVRRLELVQTLLAALVACYVGYKGPLHGYDVNDDGGRIPPSWWPAPLLIEDVWVRYVAERYSSRPFEADHDAV